VKKLSCALIFSLLILPPFFNKKNEEANSEGIQKAGDKSYLSCLYGNEAVCAVYLVSIRGCCIRLM
jgi:hypothetical protein